MHRTYIHFSVKEGRKEERKREKEKEREEKE